MASCDLSKDAPFSGKAEALRRDYARSVIGPKSCPQLSAN